MPNMGTVNMLGCISFSPTYVLALAILIAGFVDRIVGLAPPKLVQLSSSAHLSRSTHQPSPTSWGLREVKGIK